MIFVFLIFFLELLTVAESYGSYPRDGMQEGHDYSLGAYYSCLEAGEASEADPSEPPFTSQYCHVQSFVLPKNITGILGQILSNMDSAVASDVETYYDDRGIIKPLLPPFTDQLGNPQFQVIFTSYFIITYPI